MPLLVMRVSLSTKKQTFAMFPPRYQHKYRLRFVKAGQVVKIAVLAKLMINIAISAHQFSAGQNSDTVILH